MPRRTRPRHTAAVASSTTTTSLSGKRAVSHATMGVGGDTSGAPTRSESTRRYPVKPSPLWRWVAASGLIGTCSPMKSGAPLPVDPVKRKGRSGRGGTPGSVGMIVWTRRPGAWKSSRARTAGSGSSTTMVVSAGSRPGQTASAAAGHEPSGPIPAPMRSKAPSGSVGPAAEGTRTDTGLVRDTAPARARVTNESSEPDRFQARLRNRVARSVSGSLIGGRRPRRMVTGRPASPGPGADSARSRVSSSPKMVTASLTTTF